MRIIYALILLSFFICISGCDSDGYSCTSEGCYADVNSPQYLTLEDCLSVCNPAGYNCSLEGCYDEDNNPQYLTLEDCLVCFDEITSEPNNCGNLVSHEGYDYSTVQIGDQCWFAENCRYLPRVSNSISGNAGNPFYYVYDYQGADVESAKATFNYETYGVLYNWPAVMTEEICPNGWHMPSSDEFTQLIDFLGGENVAAGKLKEGGYDHWSSPNSGATNSSGFTGLPGGVCSSDGFNDSPYFGYWWSSSEDGTSSKFRRLGYQDGGVVMEFSQYRNLGFSARCVRD